MEWLKDPGFLGTHATIGADLSQLMATLFTGLFIIGWVQARKRQADAHHWLMFCGMIAMLAFFVAYYLFRQLGVLAVEGKEGFGGSQELYDHVFIPVLVVHIILVIIGLVMAIYMIILGFRTQIFVGDRRQLNEAPLVTTWKRIGAILGATTVLALLAFALRGATAGFSMRKLEVYVGFLILVAFVLGIETTIQRLWPSGARRHRVLGTFTMIIYCILFVTGTFTYTMLYILYPGKIG
ncbi:DUF420 domain-containing protein [Nitrospira moscoviensis]|uniref:DUF420 domain-containing protein n=1 Tax=Nitrospira moscoviensis TaxID=42253 RepID=A0A0K2GGG1_NITMO|nr:DUF420 domain-containing protein [Nitrospira moscoviensis]ALA60045.1 conserved membrane protein of unknown function [Nitrospira moscoviensis]